MHLYACVGTLVPTLGNGKGVDLVFTSHWVPAAQNVRIEITEDKIIQGQQDTGSIGIIILFSLFLFNTSILISF